MYHLTTLTDERIRDLRATADELRSARSDHDHRGWIESIRLWTGTAFLAIGEALVSGARPARASRVAR